MPLDTVRRAALLDAKLRALVKAHWGEGAAWAADGARASGGLQSSTFPGGAAARRGGRTAWILVEERPERSLGGALAWGRQAGVEELHLLVEDAAGLLARRASAFARPPGVWRVEGRSVSPADPDPVPREPPLPPAAEPFAALLHQAGTEAVVEHGVLRAEVLGLEVGRVVVDDDGAHLEVGVGRLDRDAQRMVHGDRPPLEALTAAAEAVRAVRRPDAHAHQMNQLARERWLRAVVVANPRLVGAGALAPVAPPLPRENLRQVAPAPAAGTDEQGRPLLVVCSTGIDVDLVPAAADARLADGRDPRLVLVVPEADDHPLTRALAARLVEPAEVVTLPAHWRSL